MSSDHRLCKRCQYIQTTDEERVCTACRTHEPRSDEWWRLVLKWEGTPDTGFLDSKSDD